LIWICFRIGNLAQARARAVIDGGGDDVVVVRQSWSMLTTKMLVENGQQQE